MVNWRKKVLFWGGKWPGYIVVTTGAVVTAFTEFTEVKIFTAPTGVMTGTSDQVRQSKSGQSRSQDYIPSRHQAKYF